MRNESSNDTEREKISNSDSGVTPVPMPVNTSRMSGMSMKELRAEIKKLDRIDSTNLRKGIEHAYSVLDIDTAIRREAELNAYLNDLRDAVDSILEEELEAMLALTLELPSARRLRWKGPGWLRVIRSQKMKENRNFRDVLGRCSLEHMVWDLTKVIDYDSSNDCAYEERGMALGDLGKLQSALADFNQAIELRPYEAAYYVNRGLAHAMNGEEKLAMDDYNAAINLDTDMAEAYCNRGVIYVSNGQLIEALYDFSKAININPIHSQYYSNRGNVYGELGKMDLAIDDYDMAIVMNEKYPKVYANRGLTYFETGDFEQAVRDISKAIELGLSSENLYSKRAAAYRAIGKYEESDQDVLRALEIGGKGYKG